MASSDSQIDKPRGCPKRAELPNVTINTGMQSINTERASLRNSKRCVENALRMEQKQSSKDSFLRLATKQYKPGLSKAAEYSNYSQTIGLSTQAKSKHECLK